MPVRSRYNLDQSPLFKLRNKARLAELLRISRYELRFLSRNSHNLYTEWDIPKRSGCGVRRVENPRGDLKRTQARLARLLSRIEPPDYLFCPVKGRSYVDNAAAHLGNRVTRCLDIKDYFCSSSGEKAYRFFRHVLRCAPDVAWSLTRLTAFRGHLPTGSPLSPIMAFYSYWEMWTEVSRIARENNVVLTVYIDDITLSGKYVPDSLMWSIKKTISRAGLRYHKEKTYVDRPADVTGVVVGQEHLAPPHRAHQKLYQARIHLDAARASGLESDLSDYSGRVSGLEGFFRQVRQHRRGGNALP